MSTSVGDVFVALGFDVDDKNLKQFDGGIRNLTGNILATVGAFSAGIYALDRWIESSTSGAVNLRNLAQETGYNVQGMEKLAYAANAANDAFSFENALAGIGNLRKSLYDISQGKGNKSAWGMLGVEPNGKDPIQIVDELAKKVHGMDRARASDLLNQTGLGRGYLSLLEEIYNNPNFIDQKGGPLALSDEDLSTLFEGDKIINNMWKSLNLIKSQMTVELFNKFNSGDFDDTLKAVDNLKNAFHGLYESFKDLDGVKKEGLLAFFGLLGAVLFPVATSIGLIAAGMNDVQKFSQGDQGTATGHLKDFFTVGNPDSFSHMLDTMGDWLRQGKPSFDYFANPDTTPKIGGATHVTVHVNGAQDPKAVADEIERAMRQRNNGARN